MARQRSAKNGAPLIVKVGSAVAKIYRDENRGCPRSTVAYYEATRRRRREFRPRNRQDGSELCRHEAAERSGGRPRTHQSGSQ